LGTWNEKWSVKKTALIKKGEKQMSSGSSWERDYDDRENDGIWFKPWDNARYTERDVYPDHGDHYVERTYNNGSTYREYDDGTVQKT
jgi:hypothetical protein